MATITVKELAARYKLAARRQALVERFKSAASRFQPGDRVKVKTNHNFKEWHGDVGEVDKYVPFGKYYVELEKNGRVIIDESYLEEAPGKRASIDDAFKDAGFAYLRDSKFGTLALSMSRAAQKDGQLFGLRDVAAVLKTWFANREPANDKEESGFAYLKSPEGQRVFTALVTGLQKALKVTGARVGFKDVGEVIVAYAEDK